MSGSSFVLDTNIVIKFFTGDESILSIFESAQTLYLPVTVLGELTLGTYRSSNREKKLKEIGLLFSKCTILNTDRHTAECYASIKTFLLNKGKPIPENDIWIAASALQHNLPIYTFDRHFLEIDLITVVTNDNIPNL